MSIRLSISIAALGVLACSDLSNKPLAPLAPPEGPPPDRERQLTDLSPYRGAPTNTATGSADFELITTTANRAVPPATLLYVTPTQPSEVWSGRQTGDQLELSRTDTSGIVLDKEFVDLSTLGQGTVHALAAGQNGTLWAAVEETNGTTLLVEFEPYNGASRSILRRLGVSASLEPSSEDWGMPIAIDGGRIYVGRGEKLLVLDETTGASLDDWTTALQAAVAPSAGIIQALGAGHGRVLVRTWPTDSDTISFDTSGVLKTRVAGVPIGALSKTPTGFAGIDQHGQVAEFLIDRRIPTLMVDQALTFSEELQGLTAHNGLVWAFFEIWRSSKAVATFVGYDPMTLDAVTGFTTDPELNWDLGNHQIFDIAADSGRMYMIRATPLYTSPTRGRLFTIEMQTGDVVADYPLNGPRTFGLCYNDGALWVGDVASRTEANRPQRPTIRSIDPDTGAFVDTRQSDLLAPGELFAVACGDSPMVSSGASRVWTIANNPTGYFAHQQPRIHGGVCESGYFFSFNMDEQTLSRAPAPGICP